MSNKEIAVALIDKLPEEATLMDIARKIKFLDAVRKGLVELECGKGIPIEEVENELRSWIQHSTKHASH